MSSNFPFSRVLPLALSSVILAVGTARAEDSYTTSAAGREDRVWSGGAEANANITTGNTDIESIGASVNVDYKPKPWTIGLKGGFMRNSTDDVERAKTVNAQLRSGMNITNNVDFFAMGTYLHNRFQGIDEQWMALPGLGIYAVNSDFVAIRFEGGIGFMKEIYSVPLADRSLTVGAAGVGLKFKVSETADFTTDAMWISPLKDSDDWRVTNVAAITTRMTEILSLKLAHNLQYRAQPVLGIFRPTDQMMTAAIVAKF